MTSTFSNVFSTQDLEYLNNCQEVLDAKAKLETNNVVYFNVPFTETIRDSLVTNLGLDVSKTSTIPMRWIKGDTPPHKDVGPTNFENTYLAYLNDSDGEFIIDDASYSITANIAFVFNEGINHFTKNTGSCPRLLLGPMNEYAESVGLAAQVTYYPTEADALAQTNTIYYGATFQIGEGVTPGPGGYNQWRIASNSTGPSPQNVVYNVGDNLIGYPGYVLYYLYPSVPCFIEGTKILITECCTSDEKYVPIETLKKGDLVKTTRDGYKKIEMIGKSTINNPGNSERKENRLYKCSKENYPELTEDLYITGCHSILVDEITDKQKEETINHLGKIYVTDKKYRLMACVDERSEPWNSEGTYTIWHLALENNDIKMNYGVFANGGLLVETSSLNYFKNWANLTE